MKDSSKEDKVTQRPKQEEKVHHFSEEEWQEVLRRKGAKHIHGKLDDSIVILNPHPDLVQKVEGAQTPGADGEVQTGEIPDEPASRRS